MVDPAAPENVTGYQNLAAYTWLLASDSTGQCSPNPTDGRNVSSQEIAAAVCA
jgi:hypothetical protein